MNIKKELNGKQFEIGCEQSFFDCFLEVKIYEVVRPKWVIFRRELRAEKIIDIDNCWDLEKAVDIIWLNYVNQLENEKLRKEKIKNFEKSIDNKSC